MAGNPFAGQSIAGLYDNALSNATRVANQQVAANTATENANNRNFTSTINQGIVAANQARQQELNRQNQMERALLGQDRADERVFLMQKAREDSKIRLAERESEMRAKQEEQEAVKFDSFVSENTVDDEEVEFFSDAATERAGMLMDKDSKKLYAKSRNDFRKSEKLVADAIAHSKKMEDVIQQVEKAGGEFKYRQPNLIQAGVGRLLGGDNATGLKAEITEDNIIASKGSLSDEEFKKLKAQFITARNQVYSSMTGINRGVFEQVGVQTALDFDTGLRSVLSEGNTLDTMKENLRVGINRFEGASATGNFFYGNVNRAKNRLNNLHERGAMLNKFGAVVDGFNQASQTINDTPGSVSVGGSFEQQDPLEGMSNNIEQDINQPDPVRESAMEALMRIRQGGLSDGAINP